MDNRVAMTHLAWGLTDFCFSFETTGMRLLFLQ